METNLHGRLARNTSLPLTAGLLPLYEAVVNSIQAIDEAGLTSVQGVIRVEIIRKPKQEILDFDNAKKKRGPGPVEEIIGFKITDNGIGFNEANRKSFDTLDSEHKASKGCRGIGRLLWLIAFKSVHIKSIFYDRSNVLKSRTFSFDAVHGIKDEKIEDVPEGSERSTTVHLDDFAVKYREYSSKSLKTISENILEHCLWYFIREGSAPKITIYDDGETLSLEDICDQQMPNPADTEKLVLKDQTFNLVHVKLRLSSTAVHALAFCADNRLVMEDKLAGKIPGLTGKLTDDKGDFVYVCYISSPFLDQHSRPERTGFDFMGSVDELLAKTEITLEEIRNAVSQKTSAYLASFLTETKKRAEERVNSFVNTKAPRYRPILSRIPPDRFNIDPGISDKELDLTLHKFLSEIEGQLLAEGHDIMAPSVGENVEDYKKRVNEYLQTAEDIKKSDLANYVSHRKVILDLLARAIQIGADGKYASEDLIHNLIMPMRKDSKDVLLDSCNLWLVDERLAFHNYLASDKTLGSMPITGATGTKEPDIVALNVFDNPILVSEGNKLPLASIVVVEIKKPMRNNASSGEEDDPVEQALGYLERIRSGKVTTAEGRPIPRSEDIPGYCYVICDITPTIEKRCKIHDMTPTSDGMGFFDYKASFKAYVEVISFDRLVNAAKERNRAFFDKLGLPAN